MYRYDEYVTAIHEKKKYETVTFDVYDMNGNTTTLTGAHCICDNGFIRWESMQAPMKFVTTQMEALWSSMVESVRKDVECTFGILKGRWRCLKLPILFHDQDDIDNMFFTCCILHNIILSWDGYDRRWESDVHWEGRDGEHDTPEEDDWTTRRMVVVHRRALHKLQDYSFMEACGLVSEIRDAIDEENGFYTRRKKLMQHFYYLWKNRRNEIEWLN